MIKTPASQAGQKVHCYIKAVGPFSSKQIPAEEVVRMWKKRIVAVLQILAYLAIILYVMTIDAC